MQLSSCRCLNCQSVMARINCGFLLTFILKILSCFIYKAYLYSKISAELFWMELIYVCPHDCASAHGLLHTGNSASFEGDSEMLPLQDAPHQSMKEW